MRLAAITSGAAFGHSRRDCSKRNTLSHANARRDASLAEQLFWSVLEHLGNLQPKFTGGKAGAGCGGFAVRPMR